MPGEVTAAFGIELRTSMHFNVKAAHDSEQGLAALCGFSHKTLFRWFVDIPIYLVFICPDS